MRPPDSPRHRFSTVKCQRGSPGAPPACRRFACCIVLYGPNSHKIAPCTRSAVLRDRIHVQNSKRLYRPARGLKTKAHIFSGAGTVLYPRFYGRFRACYAFRRARCRFSLLQCAGVSSGVFRRYLWSRYGHKKTRRKAWYCYFCRAMIFIRVNIGNTTTHIKNSFQNSPLLFSFLFIFFSSSYFMYSRISLSVSLR